MGPSERDTQARIERNPPPRAKRSPYIVRNMYGRGISRWPGRRIIAMATTTPAALPPGPRLLGPVQAVLMMDRGSRFLAACQRRYGSAFTMRVAWIGTLVYLT